MQWSTERQARATNIGGVLSATHGAYGNVHTQNSVFIVRQHSLILFFSPRCFGASTDSSSTCYISLKNQ